MQTLSNLFFSPFGGILLIGNFVVGMYLLATFIVSHRDPLYTFLWSIAILSLPFVGLSAYYAHRRIA